MTEERFRATWAEIDLHTLEHNVAMLVTTCAPARVCAVVKANGYGHGSVAIAERALAAGASLLAVALVEEGIELREAGVGAPILLLSEPSPAGLERAVKADLTPSIYTASALEHLGALAARDRRRIAVHVKLDTGMHRVGAPAEEVVSLAKSVLDHPYLDLEGLWTHFAVADEAEDPFTDIQLGELLAVRDELALLGAAPSVLHASNSAGALYHPAARLDLVRCGLAIYGYLPGEQVPSERALSESLQPVLSLKARVQYVKRLPAGTKVSYGRHYELAADATIATVPVGYHDGVARRYGLSGGQVLIGGRRHRVAGTVTMDQLLVDCGDAAVQVDDEVVLIGRQGAEQITAGEWGSRLGLLAYEVLCGIGQRVPHVIINATGS